MYQQLNPYVFIFLAYGHTILAIATYTMFCYLTYRQLKLQVAAITTKSSESR